MTLAGTKVTNVFRTFNGQRKFWVTFKPNREGVGVGGVIFLKSDFFFFFKKKKENGFLRHN